MVLFGIHPHVSSLISTVVSTGISSGIPLQIAQRASSDIPPGITSFLEGFFLTSLQPYS